MRVMIPPGIPREAGFIAIFGCPVSRTVGRLQISLIFIGPSLLLDLLSNRLLPVGAMVDVAHDLTTRELQILVS